MISNRKYWEQRKAWNMYGYMQSAENNAKEIAEIYRRTNNVMCAGMDKIFDRFKSQLKLTDEQAIQLLKAADTSDVNQVIRTLNNNNNTKAYADLYKELSTPAYRYRLKLIEEQQMLIDAYMEQTYKLEKQVNTSHYRELMNQAYNKSIYDIQQMSGFGFSFSKLDDKVVKRVLNSTWSGENYSKRIWNNTSQLAKELKQEMLVSLLTGRTDKEAAKVFEYKMSAGASNARRLIRTESCHVANEMDMKAYEEAGIDTYVYVATLDLKTSTICAELDGKRFKVKDEQPGVNAPPMHPWCRSTTICDISDEELSQMKRRSKNPATGKSELVPANMTYEEWHKKFVDGNPEAELNEKMERNKAQDKKQYAKYT